MVADLGLDREGWTREVTRRRGVASNQVRALQLVVGRLWEHEPGKECIYGLRLGSGRLCRGLSPASALMVQGGWHMALGLGLGPASSPVHNERKNE